MNKLILGILWIFLFSSCSNEKAANLDLEAIYKAQGVEGCFLLKSLKSGQVYAYNSTRCEQGFLPASTFKIPNSIIALETGVASDENLLIKWDSVPRQVISWNQDHTMKTAFQTSCVPYYQEIAARIGTLRMQEWVNKLEFGQMEISDANLTDFWLKGNSKITPYQQMDFLERLMTKALPIKTSTWHKINDIMLLATDSLGVEMRGKTGWAIVGDKNLGWFVGTIERPDGERFIFVNNVECKINAIPDDKFMMSRKAIVGEVLKKMGIIL